MEIDLKNIKQAFVKLKKTMELEYFPFTKNTGPFNMAADEFMVSQKRPCVRLYGWEPSCLTLGHHQSSRDIDTMVLKANAIDITRRPTGGKAVLHWNDLTYSLILPHTYFTGTIKQSYEDISSILLDFFRALGLAPKIIKQSVPGKTSANCFEAPGWFEISVQNKKLIGNAQARKNNMVLQQGTIPIELNTPLLNQVFMSNKQETHGAALKNFPGMPLTPEEGADVLYRSFKKKFILKETDWRPAELEQIKEIVKEKYGFDRWIFKKKVS